jgi:hypothetical protein
MLSSPLDCQLRDCLLDVSEIGAAGFSVREDLTGAGVTVLKGRTYFGSWRVSQGSLIFVSANMSEPHFFAESLDEAVRHTLLLILRNLEVGERVRPARAAS